MTDKFKAIVRQHAAKTGMSHQAAWNDLKRAQARRSKQEIPGGPILGTHQDRLPARLAKLLKRARGDGDLALVLLSHASGVHATASTLFMLSAMGVRRSTRINIGARIVSEAAAGRSWNDLDPRVQQWILGVAKACAGFHDAHVSGHAEADALDERFTRVVLKEARKRGERSPRLTADALFRLNALRVRRGPRVVTYDTIVRVMRASGLWPPRTAQSE